MSHPVKIQLSLEALERLIGGDSQVEVELRTGVVQEFARRHLKAVANSEVMQALEKYLREIVKQEIAVPNWKALSSTTR